MYGLSDELIHAQSGPSLLIVVSTPSEASELNKALRPGSRAIAVGERTAGLRFDGYLLLHRRPMSSDENLALMEWIETAVKTRIRPRTD